MLDAPHREVRMKKAFCLLFLILGAALLISGGVSVKSTRAAESPKITIVYSSNLFGYMEPCG
jgi:ABC-type phosphate transport system substrate-binding protein